jgi:hypothetical protein
MPFFFLTFCLDFLEPFRNQEDCGFRPDWAKKVSKTSISTNELGVVIHTCDPSYVGGKSRRIVVGGLPQAKT